jgi:hypothetical protein
MTEQNARPGADTDLDAEISALFVVEPSPHFVSRARARVADEARHPSRVWRWWFVPASAIAVTAIAVAVWPERPRETNIPPLPTRSVGAPVATTILVESPASIARAVSSSTTVVVIDEGAKPGFEVIVDPAESAALRRLVARAGAPLQPRTAVVSAPATDPEIANDAIEILAIADVQPISIEPLALDEGVAQ